MRRLPVRQILSDRLQAVRACRSVRRHDGLECLRRARERVLQDPEPRSDYRTAHPFLIIVSSLLDAVKATLLQSSGLRLNPSLSF